MITTCKLDYTKIFVRQKIPRKQKKCETAKKTKTETDVHCSMNSTKMSFLEYHSHSKTNIITEQWSQT